MPIRFVACRPHKSKANACHYIVSGEMQRAGNEQEKEIIKMKNSGAFVVAIDRCLAPVRVHCERNGSIIDRAVAI